MLYVWHTFFCVVYYFYVLAYGGDAVVYFEDSLGPTYQFAFGTDFIVMLTKIFSTGLHFSFFNIFLVFNIFGVIGLIAFDGSLRTITVAQSKRLRIFATVVVFLPSISFWSSAIGKDGIAFMAAGLVLWASLNIKSRYFLLFVGLVALILVRPHIAAILLFSLFISVSVDGRMRFSHRVVMGVVTLLCGAVLIPLALNYAGVTGEDGQGGDVSAYVDERQSYNQDGGGAIDISSLNPPMQFFSYIFRPLPFEIHSVASFASSLDNMILILLFLMALWSFLQSWKNMSYLIFNSFTLILFFSIISWTVLALTTSNSGIAVRQKWMFLPMMIFLAFFVIGRTRPRL